MPHYYYRCSICTATLAAPTKGKLVPLMLTHVRDHHGMTGITRPKLREWEKQIKSFEPEGPRVIPPMPEA